MNATISKNISLKSVDTVGATFRFNGRETKVLWATLHDAANGRSVGIGPVQMETHDEVSEMYAQLERQALARFAMLPRRLQGITVVVLTRTGGATWEVCVYDAANQSRRDLMHADEGMSHGHQSIAISEAEMIAQRIGSHVQVLPL